MAIGIIDKIQKMVIAPVRSKVAGTEGPILGATAFPEDPEVLERRSMILRINHRDTS